MSLKNLEPIGQSKAVKASTSLEPFLVNSVVVSVWPQSPLSGFKSRLHHLIAVWL